MTLPRKPHHKQLQPGEPPRRRKRINQVSPRRSFTATAYEAMKAAVFVRDGHRCLLAGSTLGPCRGELTPHHLWKSGQGGPDNPCNVLTLCKFHNGLVETMDRADAEALGLVVRWGETCGHAWRRLVFHGIVRYWFDGRPAHAAPEPSIPGHPYELVRR